MAALNCDFGFSFILVEIRRMDGVTGGFYLQACLQGKAYWHNIRDIVSNRMKGLFTVFVLHPNSHVNLFYPRNCF